MAIVDAFRLPKNRGKGEGEKEGSSLLQSFELVGRGWAGELFEEGNENIFPQKTEERETTQREASI